VRSNVHCFQTGQVSSHGSCRTSTYSIAAAAESSRVNFTDGNIVPDDNVFTDVINQTKDLVPETHLPFNNSTAFFWTT
jgi:hypothetical protein